MSRALMQGFSGAWLWALLWCVVAAWVNAQSLINLDNGWLLYAAGRMQDGAQPYVDFYETNPPLVLWLFSVPAWLARMVGAPPVAMFHAVVLVLAAISLWLAYGQLKRHPHWQKPAQGGFVLAALAQAVLGCSTLLFGQREHLFILLALPYFVWAVNPDRAPLAGLRAFIIPVMAAVGFCIKPFFALIWLAGVAFDLLRQRSLRPLFARDNVLIVLLAALYLLAIAFFTPDYLHVMLPLLSQSYSGFDSPWWAVALRSAGVCALYGLPLFFLALDATQRKILAYLLGALLAMAVQHKGWLNHFYPVLFFGAWLFAALFAQALAAQRERAQAPSLPRFALLWLLAFVPFALPPVHMAMTRATEREQRDYIGQLAPLVEAAQAQGQPMMVLSFDLGAAFPAVNALPVSYPFRLHHLWMWPAIVKSALSPEKSQPLTQWLQGIVVEDLARFRPALVVVDSNAGLSGPLQGFDFIAELGKNPGFAQEWKNYRQLGKIDVKTAGKNWNTGQYRVYARIP